MMPGGRMNPKQMKAMMKRMGIDQQEVPDVEAVVIRTRTKELVFKDRHSTTRGCVTEEVGGGVSLKVGWGDDPTSGTYMFKLQKDRQEQIGGSAGLWVQGTRTTEVNGKDSLTVGGDRQVKVGMKDALEAAQEIHLKSGMKVVIEAGLQLSLKGPGGFIDISPAGVTIQGKYSRGSLRSQRLSQQILVVYLLK